MRIWLGCFLFITMTGCDSTSKLVDPEEEFSALRKMENSSMNQSRKFYCTGQSLGKPGEESKTNHFSSVQYFSDDIVDHSSGGIALFSFIIFAEDPSESNWTIGKHEHVVRTAACKLPDVKDIEKLVAQRFIDHGPFRWLPEGKEPSGYQYVAVRVE